jgi:hypothetical protein
MDNVTIRDASDKDIPLILGLLYDLGRPKPQKDSDVDTFRKLVSNYVIDSDKKILVAAFDDMEIVGMISVIFLPRLNRYFKMRFRMVIKNIKTRKAKTNQFCIALAKEKNVKLD